MFFFRERDGNFTILLKNRVSEYITYLVLKHIESTQIYRINKRVARDIICHALSGILTQAEMKEIYKKCDSTVHFKHNYNNIMNVYLGFHCHKNFLDFSNFMYFFDSEMYIHKKMNHIYWSYVDRNLYNTIKYRQSRHYSYIERIRCLCKSLENVTEIDSLSHFLFARYQSQLEPFMVLQAILNNTPPILKVKYSILSNPRSCTFGEKCRRGFIYITCKTSVSTWNYCLCNAHLKNMRDNGFRLSFSNHEFVV